MLKPIEEYEKYVEITGFRNVKIRDPKGFLNGLIAVQSGDFDVQLFNADLVATWEHIYFAVINALMAIKTKHNISKSLAVETVLFASAQRQIKKALDLIGVKSDTQNVAIVIISKNAESTKTCLLTMSKLLRTNPDETVLDFSETKMEKIKNAFAISETEFEGVSPIELEQKLVDVVLERVALLSTKL
jgi:KEOPS complex subunit Cgi121